MSIFPKDNPARKKGTRARALLPPMFDLNHWEYHEQTGTDHGIDIVFDLIENDEFRGAKIEGQVKGRTGLKRTKKDGEEVIAVPIDVKTLNYGLGCRNAYVLFLIDLEDESDAYYLPVQDYFIAYPHFYKKMEANSSTYTVYFSINNRVSTDDYELTQIAKAGYKLDSSGNPSLA